MSPLPFLSLASLHQLKIEKSIIYYFCFSFKVIRRANYTEKVLVVVKFRNGHKCATSWIVVCLVAWEGIPQSEADLDYTLLSHKLNRYGLPTTRRCATNENRTCACQGKYRYLDESFFFCLKPIFLKNHIYYLRALKNTTNTQTINVQHHNV